jgi:hypothetical protein
MLWVWKHADMPARRAVREAFLDSVNENEPARATEVWQLIREALSGTTVLSNAEHEVLTDPARVLDLRRAIGNAHKQRGRVHPYQGAHECPVRWTIKFFDEACGGASMEREMRTELIHACRVVARSGLDAPTKDLALACIFCNCLNLEAFWNDAFTDRVNSSNLTVLTKCMRGDLDTYVCFLEQVRDLVRKDAETLQRDFASTTSHQVEVVSTARYVTGSAYILHGYADAMTENGVLEITSRRSREHDVKVQQASLYALHFPEKRLVMNYFVEDRLVEVRRVDDGASIVPLLKVLYSVRGPPKKRRCVGLEVPDVTWTNTTMHSSYTSPT